MYVPFLGRLSITEWILLAISLCLSWLEYVSNVVTKLLPNSIITMISKSINAIYKLKGNDINFTTKEKKDQTSADVSYEYESTSFDAEEKRRELMSGLYKSQTIQEMCRLFGYDIESRVVKTKDGYLLTLQRLVKGDSVSEDIPPRNGKVVYLHHGLLMNSEIWVTMLDKNSNIPFVLYDMGYDVWFGNNRGNKYSLKHLSKPLDSESFWNFSLDEFAFYDIPDSINYILEETGKKSLIYIGFSQGTAQAFASVSVNPQLNKKIEQIIAISPATTPHGLRSKFLDILLKSSPQMLFVLFSRKALMPSVYFWERVIYPPLFVSSIDVSNYMLFSWRSENIDKIQKLCSYAHLYSTTSVKTVVHWFQIMSAKNFQMFHDVSRGSSYMKPISYPLKNSHIPIHLIYGDSDSLVDIKVMENQLSKKYTTICAIPGHEHLDNLWGRDVSKLVIPSVLSALGISQNGSLSREIKVQ